MTRGFEAIAQGLSDAGVDTLFGVMGAGNLEVIPHWVHGVGGRYVAARHESAATAMAYGYATVSGRIGACTVTHGPGVTNALTALTTAVRAGSRLLLLTGEVSPAARRAHNQRLDHRAALAASGVTMVDVE